MCHGGQCCDGTYCDGTRHTTTIGELMEQFKARRMPSAEQILHLKYTGYFGPHNADDWFKSIFSLYDGKIHCALLLDVAELAVEVEQIGIDDFATMMKQYGFTKIPRIAFFSDRNYQEMDRQYEGASRRRGANLRFFWDSISDAVDWLREEMPDNSISMEK